MTRRAHPPMRNHRNRKTKRPQATCFKFTRFISTWQGKTTQPKHILACSTKHNTLGSHKTQQKQKPFWCCHGWEGGRSGRRISHFPWESVLEESSFVHELARGQQLGGQNPKAKLGALAQRWVGLQELLPPLASKNTRPT